MSPLDPPVLPPRLDADAPAVEAPDALGPGRAPLGAPERPGRASRLRRVAARLASEHGMLGVLLLLVVFFSVATIDEQRPTGAAAADQVADAIVADATPATRVLVVGRGGAADAAFARRLAERLGEAGVAVAAVAVGEPRAVREALGESGATVVGTSEGAAPVARRLAASARIEVVAPRASRWPTFLRADNLLNVANQIVVIAIVAIGMTLVILTGGIDLAVGSLVALSAVTVAGLLGAMGGTGASAGAMVAASLAAVGLCGAVGAVSGGLVTVFRMPPFIATLGVMLVASGLAYIVSGGQSLYAVPDGFVWLGRGATLGVPHAVAMMAVLYGLAHVGTTRTTLGRYLYAVGGNEEAARLSGVRVKGVLLFVYVASGLAAGLGGVVLASQLKSGAPTYGSLYELYVIAAVVVGGTSLTGGQGRVFGTLVGAFIIGVIQNGMNLTGIESYTQKVVLGAVILGAVLLDSLRRR